MGLKKTGARSKHRWSQRFVWQRLTGLNADMYLPPYTYFDAKIDEI
jgi:hypothetical protein